MRQVASGATDLPLAEFRYTWDGAAAQRRVFTWAGFDGDSPDPAKARRAFFIYDADNPTNKTGYKMPFADIVGGELKAVPAGLSAALGALRGARTPLQASSEIKDSIKSKLNAYYRKMDRPEPFMDIPSGVRETAKGGLLKADKRKVKPDLIALASRLANNVYSDDDKAKLVEFFKDGKPGTLEWELRGGWSGKRWSSET